MIGQTLSHYRITAKLGEGGMGAVYRAEDLQLVRPVALKFLPAELAADPQARQRLLNEARAASRLNHPHIATIYEVSESGETPFIAMELVSGESLKQVLLRGALAPTQLLEVARQIAEGLNEAHQAGVLHRDIKPANVMLDSKQRVKVLDFGLAVITGRQRAPGETEEGFISRTATHWSTGGTVPYMSPEQLRGEPTDARSDLFSFGVLLYDCAGGCCSAARPRLTSCTPSCDSRTRPCAPLFPTFHRSGSNWWNGAWPRRPRNAMRPYNRYWKGCDGRRRRRPPPRSRWRCSTSRI